MKKFLFFGILLVTLTACKPDVNEIREACQILREAGVTQDFRLTTDEKRVMTREHKIILANIKTWFIRNC